MDIRSSAAKDTAAAIMVVAAVLGGLYLFAGTWPPMVVVESRSMMHPSQDPGFGNLGTADPGDIIFVQNVDARDQVQLAVERSNSQYGGSGDVVVYYPNGDRAATPIIHRAITYIEVKGPSDDRQYRVFMGDEGWRVFGSEGIYVPELGIGDAAGYTKQEGYKPKHGGFLTQGDNPDTNPLPDQVSGTPISEPVRLQWIKGEGRGELPWLGLVKLAFGSDLNVNPPPADWARIGNAYAPPDLWWSLFASSLILVILPLGYDVRREYRKAGGWRLPPYLTRIRNLYGGGGQAGEPAPREPVAELEPDEDDDEEDGSTTFEIVGSEKGN